MKNFFFKSVILVITAGIILQAQSVYVPLHHEAYDFLKRMEAKQLLAGFKDAAKPLSRIQVAEAINGLEKHADEMTRVERETFEFLKTEFLYEMLKKSGDSKPTEARWHLYSQELPGGILNFDINYNISQVSVSNQSTTYRTQGFKIYGYTYDDIGFYFNIADNLAEGDRIDFGRFNDNDIAKFYWMTPEDKNYYSRIKSPLRGIITSKLDDKNVIQYDEIDAQLSWRTGAFDFSLEKMNNVWGYGRNGSVILSDNAPSYAQIKMRVPLSKNIDFIYFHGELNSNLTDSSRAYIINYSNPSYSKFRDVAHNKYIAAHQLEISLWDGVDFSIGESIVYSDRGPLFIYLIPVMFFKAAEHYNGDKDNCQLFGSLDLNVIRNVNAYISLFIDELNTDDLFDPYLSHRQVAFTTGIRAFDIPFNNLDLTVEYSRVNPAAYNHNIPAVTFTNNGFVLGNWMGQNADNLYVEMGFAPRHALHLTAFAEVFRKGGSLSIVDQYSTEQGKKSFLFGPLHIQRSAGLSVQYQPVRDFFINFNGRVLTIEDEANPARNCTNQFEWTIGAGLGLW
ncbi:MAG: hypothetical protein JXA06_03020 [Bacteroidetes bacterium]|nr:hypothetical protein [Bacteroidota bacterium]